MSSGAVVKKAVLAPSKSLSITIFIFLVLSLAPLGLQRAELAKANEEFSPGDLLAMIQIISPVDNGSYNRDVSLNISVEFSASSISNSTVIPYQDVNCIYRLDDGEWRNASLDYVSETRIYWSLVNRVYMIRMNCNYSATLPALSSGAHYINITIKPDAIHSFDSRTYIGNYGSEYYYPNSTVNFHITGDSDQIVPTDQSIFLTQEIVFRITVISAIIIITAIVLLSRRRKRINQQILC